jgi:hypothetical protein
MTHAATSKVENSAQSLSCKLKFVHDPAHLFVAAEPGLWRVVIQQIVICLSVVVSKMSVRLRLIFLVLAETKIRLKRNRMKREEFTFKNLLFSSQKFLL